MAYINDTDPNYDDIITRSAPSQGTPSQKRYNTTPNWLDAHTPPGPQDPYYAEWRAANPGIPESAAEPIGEQLNAIGNTPYNPTGSAPAPVTGPNGASTSTTFGQAFQFPQFTPPPYQAGASFAAPGQFSFPAFSYADFKAPTAEEAAQNPGYQFALDQGRKALENSAAAKGVLRTGGTLKDLFSWGNQFGERNYNDVFGRDLTTYGTNRANAFGEWSANRDNAAGNFATNYGVTRDSFDRGETQRNTQNEWNYRGATDTFNPLFRGSELKFADLYNRWRDQLASLTDLARPPA
jgi:hypothetical protein